MNNKLLNKWLLLFSLVIIAHAILIKTGVIGAILVADTSFICLTIMIMYFVYSGLNFFCIKNNWNIMRVARYLTHLDFITRLMTVMGFVGTIIGMIQALSGFIGLDLSNAESIQNVISNMMTGMGVALYTTLVGFVYSTLLEVQMGQINDIHLNNLE